MIQKRNSEVTPLTTAEGPVTNPSVSYSPERTIKRRKTEPRGSFKVLRTWSEHRQLQRDWVEKGERRL
jgi:hypothetical protein